MRRVFGIGVIVRMFALVKRGRRRIDSVFNWRFVFV
jgi:hypothetical protein